MEGTAWRDGYRWRGLLGGMDIDGGDCLEGWI